MTWGLLLILARRHQILDLAREVREKVADGAGGETLGFFAPGKRTSFSRWSQ
jgi:hypothetical protein